MVCVACGMSERIGNTRVSSRRSRVQGMSLVRSFQFPQGLVCWYRYCFDPQGPNPVLDRVFNAARLRQRFGIGRFAVAIDTFVCRPSGD